MILSRRERGAAGKWKRREEKRREEGDEGDGLREREERNKVRNPKVVYISVRFQVGLLGQRAGPD